LEGVHGWQDELGDPYFGTSQNEEQQLHSQVCSLGSLELVGQSTGKIWIWIIYNSPLIDDG